MTRAYRDILREISFTAHTRYQRAANRNSYEGLGRGTMTPEKFLKRREKIQASLRKQTTGSYKKEDTNVAKSYRDLLKEVGGPNTQDIADILKKTNAISRKDHPVAPDSQFKGGTSKVARLADYTKGKDVEVYADHQADVTTHLEPDSDADLPLVYSKDVKANAKANYADPFPVVGYEETVHEGMKKCPKCGKMHDGDCCKGMKEELGRTGIFSADEVKKMAKSNKAKESRRIKSSNSFVKAARNLGRMKEDEDLLDVPQADPHDERARANLKDLGRDLRFKQSKVLRNILSGASRKIANEATDLEEARFQVKYNSNSKYQGKPLTTHTFSVKASSTEEAIKRTQKHIEKTDPSDNAHKVAPDNVFRVEEGVEIDEDHKVKACLMKAGKEITKVVKVAAKNASEAKNKAGVHFSRQGYNVKSLEHLGMATEETEVNESGEPLQFIVTKTKQNGWGVNQKTSNGIWHHSEHHGYHDTKEKAIAWAHARAGKYPHTITIKEGVDENALVNLKMMSYVNKASNELTNGVKDKIKVKDQLKQEAGDLVKSLKKKMGMKEEEELDELSKKTLGSYIKKAANSRGVEGAEVGRHIANGTLNKSFAKAVDKARNRLTGIERATNRLTKEEALDESYSDLCDFYYSNMFETLDHITSLLDHLMGEEEAYLQAVSTDPNQSTVPYPTKPDLKYALRQLEDVRDSLIAVSPDLSSDGDDSSS